jgi:hypothetical protein
MGMVVQRWDRVPGDDCDLSQSGATFNNMNHPLLFRQIRLSDDHVAPIDRFRFMSRQLHALFPHTAPCAAAPALLQLASLRGLQAWPAIYMK